MCKKFLITIIAFLSSLMVEASEILVEAESFHQKGGWVVDQQLWTKWALLICWHMEWVNLWMMLRQLYT